MSHSGLCRLGLFCSIILYVTFGNMSLKIAVCHILNYDAFGIPSFMLMMFRIISFGFISIWIMSFGILSVSVYLGNSINSPGGIHEKFNILFFMI